MRFSTPDGRLLFEYGRGKLPGQSMRSRDAFCAWLRLKAAAGASDGGEDDGDENEDNERGAQASGSSKEQVIAVEFVHAMRICR